MMSPKETILYLIREELKTRKFFNTLREAGIEDVFYQPDLGTLILQTIGIDDGTDETFYFYSDLMDESSKGIKDTDSIKQLALKVYQQLIDKKSIT